MVKVNDITVQRPVGVQEKRTGCGQFEAVYNCYNKVLSVTHRHLHAWCQAKQNIMNILQSLQFTLLNFLPNAIPVPLFVPFLFLGINFSQGRVATCMSCGETLKFNSWSNGTISHTTLQLKPIKVPMTVARISQCLQGHHWDTTGRSCAIPSSPATNYRLCQFFTAHNNYHYHCYRTQWQELSKRTGTTSTIHAVKTSKSQH